jgi:hypothetical protein
MSVRMLRTTQSVAPQREQLKLGVLVGPLGPADISWLATVDRMATIATPAMDGGFPMMHRHSSTRFSALVLLAAVLAGTVNSPRLLKAALGRRGFSIDGQLSGEGVETQSRPGPATRG